METLARLVEGIAKWSDGVFLSLLIITPLFSVIRVFSNYLARHRTPKTKITIGDMSLEVKDDIGYRQLKELISKYFENVANVETRVVPELITGDEVNKNDLEQGKEN